MESNDRDVPGPAHPSLDSLLGEPESMKFLSFTVGRKNNRGWTIDRARWTSANDKFEL